MTTPRWFFLLGVFPALSLIVYGSSLGNGFQILDDGDLITRNPIIREFSADSVSRAFSTYDPELYIPLTFLAWQLVYQIYGLEPLGYHLVSVLLHGGNAMLVLWLVWLLLQQRKVSDVSDVTEVTKGKWNVGNLGNVGYLGNLFQDRAHVWALFAGTLFLLHPIHTEAVAWASALKDLLSAFFFLLSLILYLLYRKSTSHVLGPQSPVLFCSSLLLFLLALLSKVSAITLPVVLLLIDALEERTQARAQGRAEAWTLNRSQVLNRAQVWALFGEKIPFFGLALLFGVIALFGKHAPFLLERLPLLLLLAGKSVFFYMQKIIVPTPLSVFYPLDVPPSLALSFLLPSLALCALLALTMRLWKKERRVAFGLSFFLITLAPTFLNAEKAGTFLLASDQYAYVPSVGIFFLVAWLVRLLLEGRRETKESNDSKETKDGKKSLDSSDSLVSLVSPPRILLLASFATLLSLASLSHRQSLLWKDSRTLFTHAKALSPRSPLVLEQSGLAAWEQGDADAAIDDLQRALSIHPAHTSAHLRLGQIYTRQGRQVEALEHLSRALREDRGNAEAHLALGELFTLMRRKQDALDAFRNAYLLDPQIVERAWNGMQEGS